MPTRLEYRRVARPHIAYNLDVNRNIVGTPSSEPLVVEWNDNRVTGENIPDYRKVIAVGGNATTLLSATERTVEIKPGMGGAERFLKSNKAGSYQGMGIEGHRCIFSGGTQWPGTGLAMSDSVANNRALTNYYRNTKAVETRFSGLTALGELRESLVMIRNPASLLRHGISRYLRSIRRRSRNVPKNQVGALVSGTWLEYSLGWKPLINDIDGAITAFYTSDAVRPIFEMVKGTGEETRLVNDYVFDDNFGLLSSHCRVRTTEQVHVKYFGIYRSRGNGVSNIHHYGFNPAEFVPTVWELIPYSFLVDYFTNIGEIIESWSYRFVGPEWTAKTVRREAVLQTDQEGFHMTQFLPDLYENNVWGSPGSQTWREKSVSRVPSVPLDIPSLEFQVPGNWRQWANIIALGHQHNTTRQAVHRP